MSNAEGWITQGTLDEKVGLTLDEIIEVLLNCIPKVKFHEYAERVNEITDKLKKGELDDAEIVGLSSNDVFILEGEAAQHLPREEWIEEIGGSPAISAIAAYEYTRNGRSIFFGGDVVKTVKESLTDKNRIYQSLFEGNKETLAMPRTLSLEDSEGNFKIMLPYSEGRNLNELHSDLLLSRFRVMAQENELFIGLGGLNKGEPKDYLALVDEIANERKFAGIFVGTNNFQKYKPGIVMGYLKVCYRADVVSFNDVELMQVYGSLGGNILEKEGEMLKNLDNLAKENGIRVNPHQIKICHSASGAIAYSTGMYAKEINQKDLSEKLQRAVHATSLKYLTGFYPNEGWARHHKFNSNKKKEFVKDFGSEENLQNNEITYAIAPKINNPEGGLTGLGATFDGVIGHELSKYVIEIKKILRVNNI